MMEYGENTLSKRGQCLALPNPFLKKFLTVFRDSFHPTDNPDGYVNAGIAENKVCCLPLRFIHSIRLNVHSAPASAHF